MMSARKKQIRHVAAHVVVGVACTLAFAILPALLPHDFESVPMRNVQPTTREFYLNFGLLESEYSTARRGFAAPPAFEDARTLFDAACAEKYSMNTLVVDLPPNQQQVWWSATARGFPFRCAWGWYSELNGVPTGSDGWIGPPNKGIVLMPIRAGLVGDLLVWTIISAGVWNGAWFVIRSFRASRGLCVHCAYDRKGLAPAAACPECGEA